MTIQMGDVTKAMRLAFNKCPDCGDRSLIYGNWLRWCSHRDCGWWGTQPTKQMREMAHE